MTQPVGNQAEKETSGKPSRFSLILAALFGGGVVFILSQLQFRVWIEPSDSRDPPVIDVNPTPALVPPTTIPSTPPVRLPKTIPDGLVVSNRSHSPVRVVLLSSQTTSSPKATGAKSTNPKPTNPKPTGAKPTNPKPTNPKAKGPKATGTKPTAPKPTNANTAKPYRLPVHWDFSPNEGAQVGLLLSLPEGKLKLSPGDVLIAFALDGSRQYWGPYVVGKTPSPTQANKSAAWQLKLEP